MGPKLAILAVIGILYVWVIVATIPLRRAVIDEQDMNDYFHSLEREIHIVRQSYEAMKANPNTDKEELLDKEEKLALLYWEHKDFLEAVQMFQDIATKRTVTISSDQYDKKWVNSQLQLAGIYRDIGNWNAAKIAYKAVLGYDQSKAAKDPQYQSSIARDFNNLGLILYMEACGQEKEADRNKLMKESSQNLEKALTLWQKAKGENSFSEGNTLWNLYLVQRDLGLKNESEKTKLKAMSIDDKANRKVKAPI